MSWIPGDRHIKAATNARQPAAFAHRASILAAGVAGRRSISAACATETVPFVARNTADKRSRSAFPRPLRGSMHDTQCVVVHLMNE